MSLKLGKPNELEICGQENSLLEVAKLKKRRWRLVFYVIRFIRALDSSSRITLDRNKQILMSLSYVAIDIGKALPQDDASVNFIDIDQNILTNLVKEKNFESLINLGRVKQVAIVLRTNKNNGVSGNEATLLHRTNVFGKNRYKKLDAKSFFSFVYEAFKDTTIIVLLVCAILSLAFGIREDGLKEGWYDGGSVISAVFVVVILSTISYFKQNRKFEKLSNKSSDIKFEVVRDGRCQAVSIFELVVGEVVRLKIGDQIPADGLFLNGHFMKVDESSMSDERDHVKINGKENPFLLSGTKVTSVGIDKAWGQMMSSVSCDLDEQTPLQVHLDKLTSYIGKIGLAIVVLILIVMLVYCFTRNTTDERAEKEFNSGKSKFDDVINAVLRTIAIAVIIVVFAILKGLPLAITLTLVYSMMLMMSDNTLVRKLSTCKTMGFATTICIDKTDMLTLNEMKVTEFWVGKKAMKDLDIAANVYKLLQEGVSLNIIGTVYQSDSASLLEISGSPIEKAILSWAVFNLKMNLYVSKQNCDIIHVEAFNLEKKRSGFLMRKINEKVIHTHWKGAADMILAICSYHYDRNGMMKVIDGEERMQIGIVIKVMVAKSLRCIVFAHTKVAAESGRTHKKLEDSRLTLLGLIGLKDPCRPRVEEAVESYKKAGVNVKMITGDNIHTARAVAIQCGILSPSENLNTKAIVEGVQLRNYSNEERIFKIDIINVMARSSLFDKLLMVQCLKQKGHVIVVTGDGTNDASALKDADIGLSMGIERTEVAKESSDIIILNDNFSSVVAILRWGRCVNNNIQNFIQFQVTVNISDIAINFTAAVSFGDVPLTPVQLLWVNLIMDTLGALAFTTKQPTNQLMAKPLVGQSAPLITNVMWRNLIAQALYQVIVVLILQFKGKSILCVNEKIKNTLIFNKFIFCQIFNEFNARNLEEKNIFKGIHRNKLFIGIVGTTIILQVLMVEFLNKFANTKRLNWGQWGACVCVTAVSWLVGWLMKWIPVSRK